MPIPCPCCKASNDAGPSCRRCKADLSLLVAFEADRTATLDAARRFVGGARFAEAHAALDRANRLRQGDDIARLKAVAFLLARDFPAALRAYDECHDRHRSDR